MITVKLKVYDSKFNEFLEAIQGLNNDVIETIDYKFPKPKQPKVIKKPKVHKAIKKPTSPRVKYLS